MKRSVFFLFLVSVLAGCSSGEANVNNETAVATVSNEETMSDENVLRHMVLFKFKEDASEADKTKVVDAFEALPSKIKEISGFEWGTNNSPEGLDKGFTHAFLLSFNSEADRAAYLPHPDHKAFGGIIGPYIEDVLVVDYWAK